MFLYDATIKHIICLFFYHFIFFEVVHCMRNFSSSLLTRASYAGFLVGSSYFQEIYSPLRIPSAAPAMQSLLRLVCPQIARSNVEIRFVEAKQLWNKFDSEKSDHKPWLYPLSGSHNALIFNLMMRGIKKMQEGGRFRYNNGYGKEETAEAYQLRLALLAVDEICNILRNTPSIDVLFFEEGPIESDDIALFVSKIREQKIPGWEDICFAKTPWGVATCFKSNAVAHAFFHDESLAKELGALVNRCETFVSSDNNRLVHLHGEHGNPQKFYRGVLTPILMDRMRGDYRFSVDTVLGDKNLSPEEEKEVLLQAYSDALVKLAMSGKSFSLLSVKGELTSSYQGHIKLKGEDQEHHTVDSALKLMSTKVGEEYRRGTFYRRLLGLAFCGGAFVTSEGTFDLGISEAGMLMISSSVKKHLLGFAVQHPDVDDESAERKYKH